MVRVGFCPQQQSLNFVSIVVKNFYEGLEKEKDTTKLSIKMNIHIEEGEQTLQNPMRLTGLNYPG